MSQESIDFVSGISINCVININSIWPVYWLTKWAGHWLNTEWIPSSGFTGVALDFLEKLRGDSSFPVSDTRPGET